MAFQIAVIIFLGAITVLLAFIVIQNVRIARATKLTALLTLDLTEPVDEYSGAGPPIPPGISPEFMRAFNDMLAGRGSPARNDGRDIISSLIRKI